MKTQTTTEEEYLDKINTVLTHTPANGDEQSAIKAVRACNALGTPVAEGLYSRLLHASVVDLARLEQELKATLAEFEAIRASNYARDEDEYDYDYDDPADEPPLTDGEYRQYVDEQISYYSDPQSLLAGAAQQSLAVARDIMGAHQAGVPFTLSAEGVAKYSSIDDGSYHTTKKTKKFTVSELSQLTPAVRNWVYELTADIEHDGRKLHLNTVTVELSAGLKDYAPMHTILEVLQFMNAAQIASLLEL